MARRCNSFVQFGAAVLAAALTLTAVGVTDAGHEQRRLNEPPIGFTALFNGKDTSGWRGRPHLDPRQEASWSRDERAAKQAEWDRSVKEHWSVQDGELVNDGQGAYLTTGKEYGDFELWLDYKTVAKADSGIYLRYNPQVLIWDYTEAGGKWKLGADKGSGGLWNNQKHERFPPVLADKPFGEWNRLYIRMVGEHVTVFLNGRKTVDNVVMENYFDRSVPVFAKGAIQLQTHGGEIRFRNLFIREIGHAEANRILAGDEAAFVSLFNGQDLTGWQGATNGYYVVYGKIICDPEIGGKLMTRDEFSDFILRFEFKVPPGGNNGLGVRAPLEGDAAYNGMEIQILDNTAKKYAHLKPYQYHGSVYGVAPAHRGFQRPVDQWNYEEVEARGPHITVRLNGFTITDVDLSKIDQPMDGKAHPGLHRTSGFLGFLGHGDRVAFRNIRVRRLE